LYNIINFLGGLGVFLFAILWEVLRTRKTVFGFATVYLWLSVVWYPVALLTLVIAAIVTGLFVVELGHMRRIKVVQYAIRKRGTRTSVAFVMLIVLLFGGLVSLGVVTHRAIVDYAIIRAEQARLAGNTQQAERILRRVQYISNASVVEQVYTRIMTAQLSQMLQAKAKNPQVISTKDIQALLSNTLQHAQRAIVLARHNPEPYKALGALSEQLMRLHVKGAAESAITAYIQAEKLDPKNPEIPFALARVYTAQNDAEKTVEALQRSLVLKKNYTPALYQYGLIALQNNDYVTATRALGMVARMHPHNANALYYYARALEKSGALKDAIAVMQEVLVLNPDNIQIKNLVHQWVQRISTSHIASEHTATSSVVQSSGAK